MNAMYAASLTTAEKTIFQSTDASPVGFDKAGVTKLIVYNHDTSNYLLIKADGYHDDVTNSPPGADGSVAGYGALTGSEVQWLPVPPSGFVILSADPRLSSIRKVNAKAAAGTISVSWGVLSSR